DIEVHFHQADWRAHQHAADPAYARVVLHVVLFPPSAGEVPAQHAEGRVLPTLVLLPLLHRDLEEYASDDALEIITARDQWERFAELAAEPIEQRRAVMRAHAQRRWQQKVHFAQRRLAQLGWMEAAHQTALEILGYQKNRAAFWPSPLIIRSRVGWPGSSPLKFSRPETCRGSGREYGPQIIRSLACGNINAG
ncbi:MAG: DUF2851 family protein, partial [Opitutaceae bacterium]